MKVTKESKLIYIFDLFCVENGEFPNKPQALKAKDYQKLKLITFVSG